MPEKQRGIYVAYDFTAAKAYVGSTEDKRHRFKKHDVDLKRNSHHNKHLQEAYNNDHRLEVLFIPVDDGVSVLQCEQALIDQFIDTGTLYNIARDVNTAGGMRGMKHSPETIARLCEIAKVRGVPRATIEAGIAARLGKKLSPEIVRQTSKERMTPEAREHLRKVNLGTKHTPEDIERMKQIKRANSGRKVTIDGKQYDSIAGACEALNTYPDAIRKRLSIA